LSPWWLVPLGGLLALDETSVGQVQICRPLVVGALVGALLGAPGAGALVGGLLEFFALAVVPAGGARFPGLAPAAVTGASAAALAGEPAGGLALGVGLALLVAELDSHTVSAYRTWAGTLIPEGEPVPARRVGAAVARAVAVDFARGALVTAGGLAAAVPLARWAAPAWPLSFAETVALVVLGASVRLGALLHSFRDAPAWRWLFVTGAAAGAAVGWFA